jgi:hypothetical protein
LGKYVIRGYLYGKDAKRQEWWRDPTKKNRFAYFVPQSALIDDSIQTNTPATTVKDWLDD